jgi:CRP-like cAMP-binding protein
MDNNHLLDNFFQNIESISPLSTQAKEMALPYLKVHTFKPNSHIIDAGDEVQHSYFIISGIARYFYINDEGKEYNKSFIKDGDVLMSFSAFLLQLPSEYFIESLSDLKTVRISHNDLKTLTKNSSIIFFSIIFRILALTAPPDIPNSMPICRSDSLQLFNNLLKIFISKLSIISPKVPLLNIEITNLI